MSDHVSTERMNEALDGLLASSEMERLDRHLAECGACRNEYARLSEVVADLRALPRGGRVPDAAWEGIARRIEGLPVGAAAGEPISSGDTRVIEFPGAAAGEGPRSRFTFSLVQLAAAAALVAALSATTVWVALDGGREAIGVASGVERGPASGAAARAVSMEDGRYLETVEQLERILDEGRTVLAPATLVTIEESLRTVDAAIAEVETALADDPGSDLLIRMLASHRSTRLGVLERAAAAVQAQT